MAQAVSSRADRLSKPGLRASQPAPSKGSGLASDFGLISFQTKTRMARFIEPNQVLPMDLKRLIDAHQGEQLSLLSQFINPKMASVLKAIGFDPVYVRGRGAHLWDDRGNNYLDMLSGFGVFGVGRSHPKVKEAIRQYLELDSPNLIKMGTQLLAGLLAKKLVEEFAPPGL